MSPTSHAGGSYWATHPMWAGPTESRLTTPSPQVILLLLVLAPMGLNLIMVLAFHFSSTAAFRSWVREHWPLAGLVYIGSVFRVDTLSSFGAHAPGLAGGHATPPEDLLSLGGAGPRTACGALALRCQCWLLRCCCLCAGAASLRPLVPGALQPLLHGSWGFLALRGGHLRAAARALRADPFGVALAAALCAHPPGPDADDRRPDVAELQQWLEAPDPESAVRDGLEAYLPAVRALCLRALRPALDACPDPGDDLTARAASALDDAERYPGVAELCDVLRDPAAFVRAAAARPPAIVCRRVWALVEPIVTGGLGWPPEQTPRARGRVEAQVRACREAEWLQLCFLLDAAPAHAALAGVLCAAVEPPLPDVQLRMWLDADDPRHALCADAAGHFDALRPGPGGGGGGGGAAPTLQDLARLVRSARPETPLSVSCQSSPACSPVLPGACGSRKWSRSPAARYRRWSLAARGRDGGEDTKRLQPGGEPSEGDAVTSGSHGGRPRLRS